MRDTTRPEPIQKRAAGTRARLIAMVEKIVATEGPSPVTTTRIAAETGLAVGTIYRYFADREALLLAAYDATVQRIVAACAGRLAEIPTAAKAPEAARLLLGFYLDAADAVPAHAGLLAAMRAIRPVEADQRGGEAADIIGDLIAPLIARHAPETPDLHPARLRFASVVAGTMVDLYLVTADPAARDALRAEMEAHVALMAERLTAG